MDIGRMHIEFKLGVDKNTNSTPNIPIEEIDVYLQDAYEQWIEQRAYGTNPKGETFEETQKRMDDLSGLVKSSNLTLGSTTSELLTNGHFVNLPTDYRHAILETAISGCGYINVIPITHDRFNLIRENPFAQPNKKCFYRLAYSPSNTGVRRFEIITDGINSLLGYKLRYIKEPSKIDLGGTRIPPGLTDSTDTIEVAEHCQREIINLAVQNALEAIGSPRSQTHRTNIIEQE